MRKFAIALIAATLAAGATGAQAGPRLTGEERLAKMLEGREAGKPVNCISLSDSRDQTVIDKTALVYKSGNTIWVNRPRNADQLDDDDILVTYPNGGSFCRLDRVQTLDRPGYFVTGFVMLDDFVPYRKVAARD